ncbi:hypothetical protein H6F77_11430 [Microcoleus sp. FACHB-831]|uniref:hypothetical protein n=1 Tax=Microcoleus sp. FACHB-831 TaxID=2692827 RepID=UPI001688FF9D|nr:hypothetical protein [Microcoleus sp. FACHB-831]MBD1921703.1 hypothetical protein [Microcoleus sp. FACHB-831]
MNRVTSWVQSIRLRQLLTAFLLGITLLFSSGLGNFGNMNQALAEAVTPEAKSYQVDNTDSNGSDAKDGGNSFIDNIVEKLNLNEPVPPATKEFLSDVQDSASDAVQGTQDAVKNAASQVTGSAD